MTVEEISKVINDCYKLGAVNVGITGGEPLEDERLLDIIKGLNPKKALINLSTTGLLLTKEIAIKLKKLKVDTVFISIDSPDPEEHDKERGIKGCFDKSVQALKIARDAGMIVTVNTVFTHDLISSGKYKELMNIVKENKASWNLIYPCFTGGWIKKYDHHDISEEDDKVIKEIEAGNKFARNDKSDNYVEYGCPAGVEKIFISQYGDVIPCACIPISFGNVLEEPIKNIWERMNKLPEFKERSKTCNVSLNKKFINKYLEPIKESDQHPVKLKEHPALSGK
jgi:MoaA/NifB/PqqE/SkfB family radical SAM enzyme